MAILDQYGRVVNIPAPTPRARTVENRRIDVWRGINPDRMALLFAEADAGRMESIGELYSTLRRVDTHVFCETEKRVSGILKLSDQIEPSSDSPIDHKICDFIKEKVIGHPNWDDVKESLNEAVFTGLSCVEPIWAVKDGEVIVDSFRNIPVGRLSYIGTDGLLSEWPRLITDFNSSGVPLPPRNVIIHYSKRIGEHPTRQGAYRPIAWMVMLKHYSIKDWWRFGEKYGIPIAIGKYSSSVSERDLQMLYEGVTNLGSDGAAVISMDTIIELINASASADASAFFSAQKDFCNAEISKASVGATLATELAGATGSRAAADTHFTVLDELIAVDGARLTCTISDQLIKPLVAWNFGSDAALPKYRLKFNIQDDLLVKSQWMGAFMANAPIEVEEYYRQYGMPVPRAGQSTVGGTGTGGAYEAELSKQLAGHVKTPKDHEHADNDQKELDAFAGKMAASDALKEERNRNLDKMIAAISSAKDFNEALSVLPKVYRELEADAMETALHQSLLSSGVAGRKTVQDSIKRKGK